MAWDALVLNAYLGLNLFVVIYVLWKSAHGEPYNAKIVTPLVILSIPMAISIHTVTAFLYNGMAARPYWNSAILAPRFLASAFCSGPAVLLILFQVLRKISPFEIKDEAIHKIAELMGNSPEICRKHYAALTPEKMHDTVEFKAPPIPAEATPLEATHVEQVAQAVVARLLAQAGQAATPAEGHPPVHRIAR